MTSSQRRADDVAGDLKRWRATMGITQDRAATLLGIPLPTLQGMESGRGYRHPRVLNLALLALETLVRECQS